MSTQPTPTPPPLAVIIQALGEAIENARELSRFAENKKERAERAEEVRALVAALDWAESPPPPGAVRDGLAELNRRLYALADLLDNGGREWREEIESVARLAKDVQTIALDWAESQPPPPPPVRLVYGSLACVQTSDLILELQRRQSGRGDFAGDIEPCLLLAVTPSDLSDYWECDESGATHPGSATPTPEEWPALVKAFERWQDCGSFSDLMETLRDAWNEAKKEGGSK